MKLISAPTISNGYSPYVELYKKIWGDLISHSIPENAISANAISAIQAQYTSVKTSNLWVYDPTYTYSNAITGNGASVFGMSAVTGSLYDYFLNNHRNPEWSISGTYLASDYPLCYMYNNWSYKIYDSVSASVSGCLAYPSQRSIGNPTHKIGSVVSAYPIHYNFCVSATCWNIDNNDFINPTYSYLVTSVNGSSYLNNFTTSVGDKFYWVVDLNNSIYKSGNTVYWWLELYESWTGKVTKSGTGSFIVNTSMDNAISATTYGGTRGTNSITGARSCLAKSLGGAGSYKWIEICGVDWS